MLGLDTFPGGLFSWWSLDQSSRFTITVLAVPQSMGGVLGAELQAMNPVNTQHEHLCV